jgi:RNA recognition motif-containing protein
VFVSNLPHDLKWFDLKDLFRRKVDDVMYCEVYEKDSKPLGFGALEFRTPKDADRAVDLMHNYEINGRKMSVKNDKDGYR